MEVIMWIEINGKKISILPERAIFSVACEVEGQDKFTKQEKEIAIAWLQTHMKKV